MYSRPMSVVGSSELGGKLRGLEGDLGLGIDLDAACVQNGGRRGAKVMTSEGETV